MENKNEEVKEVENLNVEPKVNKHHKENKELLKLQETNAALTEKVLRLNAEMQNMTRHHNEDMANFYKYDGEKVIKNILPILDNFERAIRLDDNDLTDELSKFLDGFKMIYTSLKSMLNDLGVQEIECIGKEFDPNEMEAIMTGHEEGTNPGIILEVMQKGYKYNDKVIRVAMVKVSE